MIPISRFAQLAGNPLCMYMRESAAWPENKQLERVWFLAGDPSIYGNVHMKMPAEGYEELRASVCNVNNHGYIDSTGDKPTKEAIIKHFAQGTTAAANDVIITSGANMGLLYCLMALCEEGDNILVPEFGYPFFTDVAKSLGVEARPYRLLEDKQFEVDLSNAKSLINSRTKFLFVINPSNPMGSVFSREHMLQIVQLAEHHYLPLVCDEVYYGQVFHGEAVSFGHLTKQAPVIVISGMEKLFNVPGWCTSWLIIYDPAKHLNEIRTNLEKLASIFLHTNVFTQRALPGILDKLGGPNHSKRFIHDIEKNHDMLVERFKAWNCFKVYKAQGTFYLTVEIDLKQFSQFKSDRDFIRKLLDEENVNIFPLSVMGERFHGFRMMTCANDTHYQKLFERLDRFLKKHLTQA